MTSLTARSRLGDQMLLSLDHPVSPTVSPASVSAWLIHAATSPLSPLAFLHELHTVCSSSRTCPDSCPVNPADSGTLASFSGPFRSAGISARGQVWTHSSSG